jgi:Domain of unknown function (DUF4189)
MRRSIPMTAALPAVFSILLVATPALAGYGAIAWDKATGKYGGAFNQPTPKAAAAAALSQCGASGCRLVIRPTTVCAALATTGNGKFAGAAARKTNDEARLAALSDCQKGKAGECAIRASDCNK